MITLSYYRKLLFIIIFAMVTVALVSCNPPPPTPTPTPVPTATPVPPRVKLEPLPASVQAGGKYPVKANVVGNYDYINFSTDNGIIKEGVAGNIVYWTPINSDELAGIKVEVFYGNNATPVEDVTAVVVEKASQPICPTKLAVLFPESDSNIEHNLKVQGESKGLAEDTSLRLATWPYITNNYHPQEAKPEDESWTVTVYAGQNSDVSDGEIFDLVVFAVNAAGDFRMDEYIRNAKATGSWPGLSAIEGATECLRIKTLTRE